MTDKPAPAEAAKPVAKSTHRADAAMAFIRVWLSAHPVPVDAFTNADAAALVAVIDASGK